MHVDDPACGHLPVSSTANTSLWHAYTSSVLGELLDNEHSGHSVSGKSPGGSKIILVRVSNSVCQI